MIRNTRLVATFALGAGLTAASVALAQTQTESAASPTASARPAPPPAEATPPLVHYNAPMFKLPDPSSRQPTYSVNPPPGDSGIYLPAVILGYGKSVAGCVVIGCDSGPQVGASSGSSPSGSAEPPPANPGPIDRR